MSFNIIGKLFGFFLFFYVLACVYLYMTQNRRIFQRRYAKPYTPKYAKPVEFRTKDGIKLKGAYLQNAKNAPLVLYFSGNANNVAEFIDKTASKIKGYNFIGFNYPGYAGSEGVPCEKCILKYALEIYDRYRPSYIIGRSLGTAVASYVALKRDVKKLVLITPFDSIENIAKFKYPFLPVSFLLKYTFKESEWIRKVKAPVGVLVVKNDDVIPQSSTRNLLASIPNLDKKIEIEGVKHGNLYIHPDIAKIIERLLDDTE